MTKLSIAKQTLVTRITNIKTHDWYESYETPFLFRVNMPKLFCSFRVGLNSAFYGTSKLLLALNYCETLPIISQVNKSMRRCGINIWEKKAKSCQPNVITLVWKTSNHFIKVVAVRIANEKYSKNKHFI